MANYTTRQEPQITASELAEYMSGSDLRRNAIVGSAKYRQTVRVRSYNKARAFLASQLTSGQMDPQRIAAKAKQLREAISEDAFEVQENQMNADMLDRYVKNYATIQIPGTAFIPPPQKNWVWLVSGVKVSIAPHFLITDSDRSGAAIHGAGVFEYSKSKAYDPETAKWFSTLLCLYAENVPIGRSGPSSKLSGCLDTYNGKFHSAPERRTRLLQQIEGACLAIAQRWPLIPPPRAGADE